MRRLRRESGQATVEFALVLPVLLLVLTGIIDGGVALNHKLQLTDAIRAGARVASVSRNDPNRVADTQAAVVAAADGLAIAPSSVSVTSSWNAGDPVRVSASYPYTLSFFGIAVKSGTLTSTTTERVE